LVDHYGDVDYAADAGVEGEGILPEEGSRYVLYRLSPSLSSSYHRTPASNSCCGRAE